MKLALYAAAAVVFTTMLTEAPAATPAWSTRLDAAVDAIANDTEHPLASLSVAAVREGKLVYQRQVGARRFDRQGAIERPTDANTLYRIASISKLITTLGVMRLVEEGKLSLDADVSTVLGWPLRNPHFPEAPITLRHLLTHTSSLRDDGGYFWDAKTSIREALLPGGKHYGTGAMWARNAAPGDWFQYANLPWGVIGTVMERASGERFDRLMKRLVLDPLQLRGGFNPAEFSAEDLNNTATLYRKRREVNGKEVWERGGPWVAQVDDYRDTAPVPRAGSDYVVGSNGTVFGPQGNIRLSAAGLARIMLMLMNEGEIDGVRFLPAKSVAEMLRAQWRADAGNGQTSFGSHRGLFNAWGLGNQHFLDRSETVNGVGVGDRLVEGGGFTAVGHLGDAWGLTSAFVFNRTTRNGLIFLTGGPGFDPETWPGRSSALYHHEEQILSALWRYAVQQRTD